MEIERRFLVAEDFDPATIAQTVEQVAQAYLPDTGDWNIRARVLGGGARHVVTLKRHRGGAASDELEFDVPRALHDEMLALCGAAVRKTRHRIAHGGRTWEVDVYHHAGADPAMIAEVELPSEDAEVALPAWVGREVTGDPWYSNAAIATRLQEDGR